MRKAFFQAILLICSVAPAYAQADWRRELARDYARVEAGKLLIDDYSIVRIVVEGYEPAQFQVAVHSEAPADGLISRDQFVATTASLSTLILVNSLSEAFSVPASKFLQGFSSQTLSSPIGTPDLQLNFFMTDEGIQMEVVDTATNGRTRVVWSWAEALGR